MLFANNKRVRGNFNAVNRSSTYAAVILFIK